MKKIIIKVIFASILLFAETVLAKTVGQVADTLFSGANILTKFFWITCVLVGVFLLAGCLVHYKEHRNNPKVVSMSTVITYLILGLISISIPFLNKMFGKDGYDIVNHSTSNSARSFFPFS